MSGFRSNLAVSVRYHVNLLHGEPSSGSPARIFADYAWHCTNVRPSWAASVVNCTECNIANLFVYDYGEDKVI